MMPPIKLNLNHIDPYIQVLNYHIFSYCFWISI